MYISQFISRLADFGAPPPRVRHAPLTHPLKQHEPAARWVCRVRLPPSHTRIPQLLPPPLPGCLVSCCPRLPQVRCGAHKIKLCVAGGLCRTARPRRLATRIPSPALRCPQACQSRTGYTHCQSLETPWASSLQSLTPSATARHLAALRRLPADRRTTPGQEAAPAVAAACLRACVRCRACVSCAARPLTSGCIVIVWSRVCVESCVRCAGARRCSSTSSYATYKVLTVGKVYRPSRTSSLHRRRSRDEAAPGLILIADSAQRWNLFRRAVMRCAFDRRSHSAS